MSLAGVDLNLLVALDALLAERSVTRAAERVGLSQPGMSNTLARLRKLFGDPLLVREGLTLVPTPRAESLRQPVADALSLIQHALDDRPGFDPATDPATFTVSCSDYSLLMLIGPLVRRLAAAAPGLTIQVLPRAPDPVRLLRDGDADLVIEPVEIMPEVTLPSLRLFADRWICCVWAGTTEVRGCPRRRGVPVGWSARCGRCRGARRSRRSGEHRGRRRGGSTTSTTRRRSPGTARSSSACRRTRPCA